MKKLETIWLWAVAVSVAVTMAFTAIAWVAGLALFVAGWLNG